MGRLASGAGLRTFLGASVVLLWASAGLAQVPVPPQPPAGSSPAGEVLPPRPPPPPAAEPTPAPLPAPKPRPPAPPAKPAAPPPLDPPPAAEAPPSRPAFLHTADEMERLKSSRAKREPSNAPLAEPTLPEDFVLRSSPWVDFTLTSFHLEDRTGNFLNLGVQVGGYVFERLRVAVRLVTPLEDVSDGYSAYSGALQSNGTQSFERVKARSMAMLYAASVGIMITNSKSFVFGPSLELQRTDVEAYGSALSLALPFEWTTRKSMRIGFQLALGHAFGGSIEDACRTFSSPSTSCGTRTRDRPAGTAVMFQYNMGWALGRL